ncbi:MAG: (deoxy)nucleoside triphosphate pyrophosphohydrolase [Treponema sp.]|nr:(deoxy)nucleoside triphosphate pyrophosphohydrolase [Treponema sp.]
MKTITVSGAIIIRTNPDTHQKEVFATQRGYGDWKGWWEIPGGKIESGETPEECIVREIREELAMEVKAEETIAIVDYDYPAFHLTMHCILCTIVNGQPKLLEHQSAQWLTAETLTEITWLPADKLILKQINDLLVCEAN